MNELGIVIVEDEPATARNLAHMLQTIDGEIRIVHTMPSVKEAIAWFNTNQYNYDLIFMDIRLTDGISFDIFKHSEINRPVIFVTAYDEYAIRAFKNNGIDYILKPFDEEEIGNSLRKFSSLSATNAFSNQRIPDELIRKLVQTHTSYKKSFLIHYRDKLIPLETIRIAWFYTANELVYARTIDDQQYVMEFSMEQLEQQLDPEHYFRANRQFIVNRKAICEVNFYFNSRLSLKVKPNTDEQILISKARVPLFKNWLQS